MFEITLFIPLSGRKVLWPRMAEFLANQTIDRENCQLFLLNTSDDRDFDKLIGDWIVNTGGCGYGQVNHHRCKLSAKRNLCDQDRLEHFAEVNKVMLEIYGIAKLVAQGKTLFIVEDDTLPPINAFNRLAALLTPGVFSASGVYKVRGHNKWTVWRDFVEPLVAERGDFIEKVAATGFGCIVMRTEDFNAIPLTWENRPVKNPDWPWGYDMEFFTHVQATGKQVLVDWDVYCEHLEQRD